ncbi:MAG TPA: UPF0104 family protein [Methanobacterium sp.]
MKYQALILLALGIGVLAVLVLFIGPEEILSALELANPWYVILALMVQFLLFGLWIERWFINIQVVNIKIKRLSLLPMLLVGMAVNNITPSARGGGEPVRAYILGKYTKCPMESSFATVIADRGLDIFPLFLLAVITIIFAVLYLQLSSLMVSVLIISLALLLVLFIIGFYMSINPKMGEKVTIWVVNLIKRFSKKEHSKLEKNALNALQGFQNSIKTLIKNRKILFYALPLSFLIWFVEIIRLYIIFLAFNTPISIEIIAVVFVISTLIGMIPVLPGGVGAIDGVMILLFSVAGVPPSIGAAATIVERLISFWLPSFLGISMIPYFGSGVMDQLSDKI